jgi:hypothetical protein
VSVAGHQETGRHILRELGFTTRRVGDEMHGTASITPEMHVPGTAHLRTSILATWADNLAGLLAVSAMAPRVPVTLELDVHLYRPAPVRSDGAGHRGPRLVCAQPQAEPDGVKGADGPSRNVLSSGGTLKIGFIGPGRMGRPMLDRLVAAGHDVTVLVRSPHARAAAEADRLTWASTVTATVRDADAVFVVVLTDEQVRSVCLGPDGAVAAMTPGATLVQHTTSDPTTAQLLASAGSTAGSGCSMPRSRVARTISPRAGSRCG